MRRACVAVGLSAVVAAVAMLVPGTAPLGGAEGEPCTDGEASYTTGSMHDLRSFSDAAAIVRPVKERIPPPSPHSPEGYAGYVPRIVTMRVERVLWRRPHAPEPPATSRFADLGWWGEPDERVPMVVCGETRMALGARYLAAIVHGSGTWYPILSARLLLDGDRVVGGVDGGEPTHAHRALAGRRVAGAVRMIRETKPYRAVVRDPSGSPARRWQRVDADDYRIWREPFPNVVVASGVTDKSRWEMYARRGRRGGICVGMSARPLWRGGPAPSGEGCGAGEIGKKAVRPSAFYARHRGQFAYGRAGTAVWAVRVRFGDRDWQRSDRIPGPPQLRGESYFWVVASPDLCPLTSVQALGRGDRVLSEERLAQATC